MRRLSAAPSILVPCLPRVALLVLFILCLAVVAPILRSQETPTPQPDPASTTDWRREAGANQEAIRARLEGKPLFLRVFDLNNQMEFDETGKLLSAPQQGSFTLCGIDVKRVRFSKHKVDIEGYRMGLHFFGALPYEDDTRPFERVRISKKPIHLSIQRELVILPKKKAFRGQKRSGQEAKPGDPQPGEVQVEQAANSEAAPMSGLAEGVTTTTSPAHAAHLLEGALGRIFADRIDGSLVSTLPDYWQRYFAAKNGGVVNVSQSGPARPGLDVSTPKILSSLEPGSNEFAQRYNIAGITLYQTVVDAQGRPQVTAVSRPIGFGLDELAVDAIQKANFQPGLREGKPLPVTVDLLVTFRIYSHRTRGPAAVPTVPGKEQVASKQE